MKHRMKVHSRRDRRVFARTARKTKAINVSPRIMRGGIRL